MSAEQTRTCDECAGTITADEILRRKAGLVKGRLLCVACVEALRRQIAAERAAASRSQTPAGAAPAAPLRETADAEEQAGAATSTAPADSAPPPSQEALERPMYSSPAVSSDEAQSAEAHASETATRTLPPAEPVASRAVEELPAAAASVSQAGPARCMVFHGRTTEAGLADLQRRVDVWLREHPDLVVRSSGVTVGPYDGAPGEHRLYVVLHF